MFGSRMDAIMVIMRIHSNVFLLAGLCIVPALLNGGCKREEDNQQSPSQQPAVIHTVSVAAAADLKYALDEIVEAFQKSHPAIKVNITYGSSGNFYSQLSNRAPFDIFFSADIDYPKKLVAAGLAVKGSQFKYAVGRIVVWVPNDSPIDVEKLGIDSLVAPSVKKIAIANPEHAPYGRAAVAAMKKLDVYDRVKDRLVLGENIAQTAQFVETGAADVGIIALSLAMSPAMKDKGKYWPVPLDAYPTLEQGGVLMSWAKNAEATEQFKTFITGPDGRAVLKRYGFTLPSE
jgi:molybdate transport system substrate-binding protein